HSASGRVPSNRAVHPYAMSMAATGTSGVVTKAQDRALTFEERRLGETSRLLKNLRAEALTGFLAALNALRHPKSGFPAASPEARLLLAPGMGFAAFRNQIVRPNFLVDLQLGSAGGGGRACLGTSRCGLRREPPVL